MAILGIYVRFLEGSVFIFLFNLDNLVGWMDGWGTLPQELYEIQLLWPYWQELFLQWVIRIPLPLSLSVTV